MIADLKAKVKARTAISSSGCWEWQGCLVTGYGQLTHKGKSYYTHRVMMGLPKGMNVNHHCDNKKCCNPEHLYVGTQAENMRDLAERGGRVMPKGSSHHNAILDEHDVYGMKILLRNKAALGLTRKHIAEMFGVTVSTVKRIISDQYWKHVTLEE